MKLADIEPLLRSRLSEGETITEVPADYFDDRMYAIATTGAPVYVYTISASDLYGVATLDALETWRSGDNNAGRVIDAVLDYARRNGQPAQLPGSEMPARGASAEQEQPSPANR